MISKYRISRFPPYSHESAKMAIVLLFRIHLYSEIFLQRLKICRENAPLTDGVAVNRVAPILRRMPNQASSSDLLPADVG